MPDPAALMLDANSEQQPPIGGRPAAAVLALAVAARVAMLLFANSSPERFDYPDSRRYAAVARNIAEGNGPIESMFNRSGTDPLYPYLLSPAWRRDGATVEDVYTWARLVNIALGLLGLAAVLGLGRIVGGPKVAVAAGLIFALDPILVFFHALPLTEVPFIGLLWTAIYLIALGRRRASPLLAVLIGAILALGALMRGSALPLAFLLPVIGLMGAAGSLRERLAVLLFSWAAIAITISPAVLRNRQLHGKTSLVRSSAGASLLEAWGPWADGGPGMEKVAWPAVPAGADEFARDEIYRDAAVAWARANPWAVLRLAVAKARRTWSIAPNAPGYTSGVFAAVGWLTVLPVYILALLGLGRFCRKTGPVQGGAGLLGLLLAPATYFTLLHMVFVGSVRYRVPAMPGLYILAALAIVSMLPGRERAASPPRAIA